jgi:hypothetical protein
MAHSKSDLKLEFRSNINSHSNDESWAFNRIRILADGSQWDVAVDETSLSELPKGHCLNSDSTAATVTTIVDEISDGLSTGWSSNQNVNIVEGDNGVHGIYGNNHWMQKEFDLSGTEHTTVRVTLRYWMVGSWDHEHGRLWIDGTEMWNRRHHCSYYCESSAGGHYWPHSTPTNDWADQHDYNGRRCYHDIDFTLKNANDKITIKMDATINEGVANEAWAFNRLVIKVGGDISFPPTTILDERFVRGGHFEWCRFSTCHYRHSVVSGDHRTGTLVEPTWHGVYAAGYNVGRTFSLKNIHHTHVRVRARFWAVDSWDHEDGYMTIDNAVKWQVHRRCNRQCSDDYDVNGQPGTNFGGDLYNPWAGNRDYDKCWWDIDEVVPHTGDSLKVHWHTSLGQGWGDESFDINRIYIQAGRGEEFDYENKEVDGEFTLDECVKKCEDAKCKFFSRTYTAKDVDKAKCYISRSIPYTTCDKNPEKVYAIANGAATYGWENTDHGVADMTTNDYDPKKTGPNGSWYRSWYVGNMEKHRQVG